LNYTEETFVMFAKTVSVVAVLSAAAPVSVAAYRNEIIEQDPAVIGEAVKTPRPHTYIKEEDLPASWDYRPLGLLTTDLNQHIPTYCGKQEQQCGADDAHAVAYKIFGCYFSMFRILLGACERVVHC
jgi:hypothetical protein